MAGRLGLCDAILFTPTANPRGPSKKWNGQTNGEVCEALAAFESRGRLCCWVHYYADTVGPRAGQVEFRKETKDVQGGRA